MLEQVFIALALRELKKLFPVRYGWHLCLAERDEHIRSFDGRELLFSVLIDHVFAQLVFFVLDLLESGLRVFPFEVKVTQVTNTGAEILWKLGSHAFPLSMRVPRRPGYSAVWTGLK